MKNSNDLKGRWLTAFVLCLAPALQAEPAADVANVHGNAADRERTAMPPQAVLTHGAATNSVNLLLTVESHVAGDSDVPATATLRNTYWKLVALDGQPVTLLPGQEREVRITLHSAGARLAGFSGCNPLMGTYVREGQALKFTQLAGTRMACTPPIDALERKVQQVLGATSRYRIERQSLSLLQGGQVLARFEAVYL